LHRLRGKLYIKRRRICMYGMRGNRRNRDKRQNRVRHYGGRPNKLRHGLRRH
jgi:hypothetical protein